MSSSVSSEHHAPKSVHFSVNFGSADDAGANVRQISSASGSGFRAVRSKAPCSNSISIKEAATEAKRISARLEKYVDVLLDEPETSIRVLLGLDLDAESRNSNVPNIDMEIKPEAEDELWIPETPHRTISKDEAGSPILRLNASTPGLLQSPTKSPMKSGQSAPLTSFTRGQYESFNNQADEVLREAANMTAGFVVSANPRGRNPQT